MNTLRLLFIGLTTAALAGCGGTSVEAQAKPEPPGPMRAPTFAVVSNYHVKQNVAATRTGPIERSPTRVVQSMLALAETGQWEELVDRYYGERDKFRSRRDRAGLVERLEGDLGLRMQESLRNAKGLTATIDDVGCASFLDDGMPVFVLHKHEDGRWTFRL